MERRESNLGKRLRAVFWLDVALVVCEVIGTVITARMHGLSIFSYFTEDSNFFALFACTCEAICLTRYLRRGVPIPRWSRILKYVAICELTMTFLVVFLILIPWAISAGYDGFAMLLAASAQPLMHLVCPVIALASFVFLETDFPMVLRRR